jgi:hypothetical protein
VQTAFSFFKPYLMPFNFSCQLAILANFALRNFSILMGASMQAIALRDAVATIAAFARATFATMV